MNVRTSFRGAKHAKMVEIFVFWARGVLSGKVGTGMRGGALSFFGILGLPRPPFYLKIGLDIGRVFAKCIIFDDIFL